MKFSSKIKERVNNYRYLIRNIQLLCPGYKSTFTPIIVDAFGKCRDDNLDILGLPEQVINQLINLLEIQYACEIVRIGKIVI